MEIKEKELAVVIAVILAGTTRSPDLAEAPEDVGRDVAWAASEMARGILAEIEEIYSD